MTFDNKDAKMLQYGCSIPIMYYYMAEKKLAYKNNPMHASTHMNRLKTGGYKTV